MKKLFLALLLVSSVNRGVSQQLDFAKTQNQIGTEGTVIAAYDNSNQLILTGTRQLIAGSGGTNGSSNTWVKKYNTNGLLLWTTETNYTGTLHDGGAVVTAISTDNENNTYITGYFYSGTITLGNVTYSVPPNGYLDLFYAKINASGVVQWIKGINESRFENNAGFGSTINVTPDNQLILTGGYFKDVIIGQDTLIGDPVASLSGMTPFGFYAKLDSDGTPLWAKRFVNLTTEEYNSFSGIASTAVDEEGNLFFMMGLDSAVVIGNDTISSSDLTAVIKTDPSGNFIRAVIPGSTYNITREITLDQCGNLLLLGEFIDSIQIENTTLNATSSRDVFVAKFNNDLDLEWMKQFYSSGGDLAGGIACNDRNDVFFNLEFWGEINYSGPYSPSPLGTLDALLIKLDENGDIVWHKHSSGTGNASGLSVSVSPSNQVVMAGKYQGQENFDGTIINSTPTNLPDVWFAAYTDTTLAPNPVNCQGDLGLNSFTNTTDMLIYPNPARESVMLTVHGNAENADLIITNLSGRVAYKSRLEDKTPLISVAGFPEGMYIVQIRLEDGNSFNGRFMVKH